jgi:hypothetical protein
MSGFVKNLEQDLSGSGNQGGQGGQGGFDNNQQGGGFGGQQNDGMASQVGHVCLHSI